MRKKKYILKFPRRKSWLPQRKDDWTDCWPHILKSRCHQTAKKRPDRKSLSTWIFIAWKAVFQEQIGNLGSPSDSVGKNLPANAGDKWDWFDFWVEKIASSRKQQPTPVFFPGEFHGQRSLVSDSPWGHKESVMTEQLSTHAEETKTLSDKTKS